MFIHINALYNNAVCHVGLDTAGFNDHDPDKCFSSKVNKLHCDPISNI